MPYKSALNQINYLTFLTEVSAMTTLVIEHLPASDLPPQWANRLQMRPGQTVTVRIETEASNLKAEATAFVTDDPAFGIWRDREDLADVAKFARDLRASRYQNLDVPGTED